MTIHHFGPDPAEVGGMGTVLRLLAENRVGGELVALHPTWCRASRPATLVMAGRAARTVSALDQEEIVHVHLSEGGSFLREGALLWLARIRSLPTVATIHGANFVDFASRHPRLVARVLKNADVVTCLDGEALALIRQLAPQPWSELLPNPVVVEDDFAPADQTQEIVLFAGEIGHRKGADVLARAWPLVAARRPNARCLMVGPAGDFVVPQLERLVARGSADAHEMRRLLSSARVVVLPSRAEGMPMVLTEAMSVGRPFVSTPVGGIPELAQEGGVLTAVGDEQGLASCLTALLADPGQARTLGERARNFCLRTRSIEVIDGQLRRLYGIAMERAVQP